MDVTVFDYGTKAGAPELGVPLHNVQSLLQVPALRLVLLKL